MVDEKLTNVIGGKVIIRKYSQVGSGSVILPNVILEEGAVVGAMSLINKSLKNWSVYIGIPAIKIKDRKKGLLVKVNNGPK